MKKRLRFLLILSSMLATILSLQSVCFGDVPVTDYKLDVTFREASKSLKASENITYYNNYSKPLNELVLHLYPNSYKSLKTMPAIGDQSQKKLDQTEIGDISITSATLNGRDIPYKEDNQILKLKLDTPLAPGDSVKISLSFNVKIPLGKGRLGYQNDVYSITNWYPLLSIYNPTTETWDENAYHPIGESNYSEVSNYDVTLHTPEAIVTASTGETIHNTVSNHIRTVEMTSRKTRDFVFMMSRYYKELTTKVNGVNILSYYIDDGKSPDSPKVGQKMLDVVADSLQFYSKEYGPYPYPQLSIAETYLDGGAMEYPALIQMGKYTEISKTQEDDHSSWEEDAAAHETGHQWWYVAVGDNEFKEPMMDESLNTFATAYYFDKRYGKYTPNGLLLQIHKDLVKTPTIPIASSVDQFKGWSDYSDVIYEKGPELFEDLRLRLGDDMLTSVLKAYFSKYLFKNGSINDFEGVLEAVAGSNIKNYFHNAVHSSSYYPKNLELNATERKHIDNLYSMGAIKELEESKGLTLSSMLLRGMQGEKVSIVIPSTIEGAQQKELMEYCNQLKVDLDKQFEVPVHILKDSAVTSEIAKQNLIVIGNTKENKVLKTIQAQLPLKVVDKTILFNEKSLPINNASAVFLTKNPLETKNLLLVVYWQDKPTLFDLMNDNMDQYIINYGEDEQLRGQLKP